MNHFKLSFHSLKIFFLISIPFCIFLPIRSNEILRFITFKEMNNLFIFNKLYCSKPIGLWIIKDNLPNLLNQNILILRILGSFLSLCVIYCILYIFKNYLRENAFQKSLSFFFLSPLSIIAFSHFTLDCYLTILLFLASAFYFRYLLDN